MTGLLVIILPVFLVMAFGFLAVWRGFFSAASVDALMKFAQTFAIPLLLFRAISTLDLGAGYDPGLMVSYYGASLAGFFLGMVGARFLFSRPWVDSVAIGFAALFANSVLLGLPIMERAFGPGALAPNFAIISLHAPFCYLLGITTMEIARGVGRGFGRTMLNVARGMFQNALMLAIVLGFAVNLTGLALPKPLAGAFDLMALAALPTAVFALGGVLARYRPEGDLRVVLWICGISLLMHPMLALVLGQRVFALPEGMVQSAVVTAAMAPGINAFVFASLYGVAQRVVATSVLAGTLLSVISVTFWLGLLGV